jgi:LPPG:FO 2-phospho-L-lactate transferase
MAVDTSTSSSSSVKEIHTLRIVALAGGVGGAKLVDGLARILPADRLTVVVNTGDDFRHYGLAVSPDLDTVLYTLAGLAHPVNGWGIADDTRRMVEMLKHYGEAGWFGLGDSDMATNLLRTYWLGQGQSLSQVTARLAAALGIGPRLLPMSDDPVPTMLDTVEQGILSFQEYFVRHRWQPTVRRLWYEQSESAQAAPGIVEAIQMADIIVICPSNPVLSVAPILSVMGIRKAIEGRRGKCLAVSPVIAGAALKGPTVKIMKELGADPSVMGISAFYGPLIDGFVIDLQDGHTQTHQPKLVTDILLNTPTRREEVAKAVLEWGAKLL